MRIGQAAHAYEARGYGGLANAGLATYCIEGPLDEAARIAPNGLERLESLCGERIEAGWADRVISNIESLRRRMIYDGVRYFDEAFVRLMRTLPPEELMPPGLEFVQFEGLRESGPRPCRVRLVAEAGGRNSPVFAVVDGVEVEVRSKHRRAFHRALVKLVAAHDAGLDGIDLRELDEDQGAVSGIRRSHPLWADVISTPGDRDPGIKPGMYFIQPAQTAS